MDYSDFRNLLLNLPGIASSDGEDRAGVALHEHLRALYAYQEQLTLEEEQEEIAAFRRVCHSLLLQSEFGYYVFVRPRGYPGDYLTQEMMWLGRTEGGQHRYRGVTELGQLLTSITFDMAAPRANELRLRRIAQLLGQGGYDRVASIGCGSGIEFQQLNSNWPGSVFLLDQDNEALVRAETRLTERGIPHTSCQENVVRFILRNERHRNLGEHDLVYSLGLLDYFSSRMARKIVTALWASVARGGMLLLTNAHPSNPTRLWMEWVSEWYLDYKTEAVFRSLVTELEDVAHVDYAMDEVGVYQYLTVRKAL